MSFRRATGTAAIVALVALGIPATAHAGTKSPTSKQWAGDVCSAFLTFGTSVKSTITDLKGSSSVEDATSSAKEGLRNATDELEQSLDELGKPPTPNASKAQSAIQDLGSELQKDASAVEQALTPPPSTPGEIASAFASIGIIAQTATGQVKATASTLKGLKGNNELKQGFQNASSCQQLKREL